MRRFILVFAVASLAAFCFDNACADDWSPLWSTANLSQARQYLAATTVGTKALFAGGDAGSGNYSNVVDIFDTSSGSWLTATLSLGRTDLAAASAGGKAVLQADTTRMWWTFTTVSVTFGPPLNCRSRGRPSLPHR